jgi:hypothetical protein
MPTVIIDGNTFVIHREFNTSGSTVLSQVVNYLLDKALEEENEESEDKEE